MSKFYITTPIYYVNDAPHIGHAYTTIQADVMARFKRFTGYEVKFLTGTDEHGDKVARAAKDHNVSPQEWVDKTAARFQKAWEKLEISNDDFIRTTQERHEKVVKEFLGKIYENGYIYLGKYEGYYCVGCESYKDESELIDGKCPDHLRSVEWLEEENYFFKLSAFEEKLLDHYEKFPDSIFPLTKRNEVLSFIKSGLKDISITRTKTSWGIKVPWDENHVFYVWYDALINYLTAANFGSPEFLSWWETVHHYLAKDILRFHCVWWPAMCMAASIPPPNKFIIHGFLLLGGSRLSKTRISKGESPLKITQVSPEELCDEFGAEVLKYCLIKAAPLGLDAEFSEENLVNTYNTDLANGLGNLIQRVVTLVVSKLDGLSPGSDENYELKDEILKCCASYFEHFEHFAPHQALDEIMNIVKVVNADLEKKEPWKLEDNSILSQILGGALEAIRFCAILLLPVMPSKANEILRAIGAAYSPSGVKLSDSLKWGGYQGGIKLKKISPIFPRRIQQEN